MKLLGNTETLESFKSELHQGKLSHAFIIEGARGSGRLTLARALSSLLVCDASLRPCGTCPSCKRAESGTHPDVYEILHKDRTGQIKIDDIRVIIEKAHIKPSEAEYKVFIIENAQMMNAAAQNALLQIFEEPPPKTVFFLLSTDRNLLLKTLLSRARVLKTEKLKSDVIERFLAEKYPDKKDFIPRAVRIADGAAGAAEELIENEASPETLKLVTEYMRCAGDGAGFFELGKIFSPVKNWSREEFSTTVSYVSLALRDLAHTASCGGGELMFFEECTIPEKLSARMGLKKVLKAFDLTSDMLYRSGSMNLASAIAQLNTYFASDYK